MKKLYYYFFNETFNNLEDRKKLTSLYINDLVPSSSEWYSSLQFFKCGAKTLEDFYSTVKNKIFSGDYNNDDIQLLGDSGGALTAKNCPGIKKLFKNSFLITSPCDIHIAVNSEMGSVIFNTTDENLVSISTHTVDQYKTKGSNLFLSRINVKFEFPIYLFSDSNWVFLQPTYHTHVPWEVMPGVVENGHVGLNINTLFPLISEEYLIKKGTPICYIYFDEKHKLEYTKKRYLQLRTTFLNSAKDIFK